MYMERTDNVGVIEAIVESRDVIGWCVGRYGIVERGTMGI